MDKDDAERMMEFIEKQVEKGRQEVEEPTEESIVPLMRSDEDGPLIIEMKLKPKPKPIMGPPLALLKKPDKKIKIKEEPIDSDNEQSECSSSKRMKRERRDSVDRPSCSASTGWLQEGLVVKVITKTLGEKYYKAKGIVQSPVLESGFVAKIKLISPDNVEGAFMKLDQEYLETVIPAIGKVVRIVKGAYTGLKAIIRKVRIDDYCVDVEIIKNNLYIRKLGYECICKCIE